MKRLGTLTLLLVSLRFSVRPAAAFTSYYVFGDSLSCTATNPGAGSLYYGKRYSNGRVWVELLAQMQGLAFNPSNNPHAYFGNTSTNLYAQTVAYTPPVDASNALVVIWVNNADFYDPVLYDAPNSGAWLNLISNATNNHYKAITNLYAKGIRTLVMPSVVDIATVPFANNDSTKTNYIHQQCVAYNAAFSNTLNRARANCSGLVIYSPDYFTLLSDMLKNAPSYGLTNALYQGRCISAIYAQSYYPSLPAANINGYGTNYVFWDDTDPTAKVHYIMASTAQQMISPVNINQIIPANGSNQLELVNVPVYTNTAQNGLVLSRTNLALGNWRTNTVFSTTNTTQTVWVTNNGPQTFYRLQFPYVWKWP